MSKGLPSYNRMCVKEIIDLQLGDVFEHDGEVYTLAGRQYFDSQGPGWDFTCSDGTLMKASESVAAAMGRWPLVKFIRHQKGFGKVIEL